VKCSVGKELPRELGELGLFGPEVKEGPGGSDRPLRGRLRSSGIRAGLSSLCSGSREKQKTQCRPEGKYNHLIPKIGR
jgi:hypothetical protein